MTWIRIHGESWIAGETSFLLMWMGMMAAMMLPSLVPALWRYRQTIVNSGELPPVLLAMLTGGGYLLVWALLGAVVYPLGVAVVAAAERYPALKGTEPIVIGLVVLAAGALQFTRWKTHHLACCRSHYRECRRHGHLRTDASAAWLGGLRLGLHCSQCCAGLTAVLLVTGIMDIPAMLAVTAGITLERLAAEPERVARSIGILMAGLGLFLTLRSIGPW